MVQRIAKNSAILLSARIVQIGFTTLFSIYVARSLGATEFGKWAFALAFTTFFLVFADFGLSTSANQKVARCRENGDNSIAQLVGTSLFLKSILAVPVFVMMVGLVNQFDQANDTKWAVYILGLSVLLNSFTMFFSGVFRGLERMEYEAAANVLERPFIFLVGVWLLMKGNGIISLAILFLVARLMTLVLSTVVYFGKVRSISLNRDYVFWKQLIVGALPFGVFLILGTIYFQIDTIMLSVLQDDQAVGLFESVIRLAIVLMIIPEAFTEAIFPVVSRSFHLGQDLTTLYHKTLKLMAIIGLPITVGLLGLADRFVHLLYGAEYLTAVPALRLIALMITLRFLAYVPGIFLASINKQTLRVTVVGICALFNIVLNLLIIPRWGFVGAAFNTLLTNIVLLCLYIFFVWHSGYAFGAVQWGMVLRILACAALLYVFIVAFREVSLLMLIPIGAVVYLMSLLLLGVVKRDERAIVRRILALEVTNPR
jgi:O-antigen/teichoic acid export membrane protein